MIVCVGFGDVSVGQSVKGFGKEKRVALLDFFPLRRPHNLNKRGRQRSKGRGRSITFK